MVWVNESIKKVSILLLHGTVITMDPQRRIIEEGAVAIDGKRILDVGTAEDLQKKYVSDKVIDCAHKVIMPGLIDAHGHAGHALFKGIGCDSPSHWMHIATPTYHHFTTDEYWLKESRVAALERLKMGVTCGVSVISSAQRSDDPVFAGNCAKGYSEVGIRNVVAVGPCNPPYPRKFSRIVNEKRVEKEYSFDEVMAGAEAAIAEWNHGADDKVRVFIAPFVLLTSIFGSGASAADVAVKLTDHDRYMMKRVRQVAAKYKTRIHTEAFGGMIRLAARCDDALLGPDVHLQHCTGISFEEAMILAKTGTHVCSAPGAGQARGRCPIPELIELGANVVITTDGNSPRTPFDLFQAARKTQMIQQMLVNDSCLLPCGKLLEMITIDAAKALGWDDELGSLESGKKADVIIVNMLQPHLMPEIMPVHRLIQRAVGNDVETSIVDGQIIMENRQVKTIDEKEALLDGHKEIMETIKRAGLEKNIRLAPTFWGHSQGWLDEEPVDYQSLISRP